MQRVSFFVIPRKRSAVAESTGTKWILQLRKLRAE
jgi:hypothetical protein